jgi:hypothetical protein
MRPNVQLRTTADLDASTVTALLSERHPDAEVGSVEVRTVHQGTSTHVFLDVEYVAGSPPGLPTQLFLKTQLQDSIADLPDDFMEALSEGGGGASLFAGETRFYREIRPTLAIEAPVPLAAALVPGPAQFLILTDDLTVRDARFPSILTGLGADEVAAVLDTLATVHAAYWADPRLEVNGELAWLDHAVDGPFSGFLRDIGFDLIREALVTEPFKGDLLRRASLSDGHQLEHLFWRRQELIATGPSTFLHGDPHPGNLYLLPDGRAGLLDWQLVRRGSWAHDVSYAIVAALDPSTRRAAERDLLASYLERLAALGVSNSPSADDAWELYRTGAPWGFSMWAITPPQMYSEAIVATVIGRFAEAMVDHDAAALLA